MHFEGANADATVSGIAAMQLLLTAGLYAAGPQRTAEPEPAGAAEAQEQAAVAAEPAQRQGTKVSQKKVDQVKVGLHPLSPLALAHLPGLRLTCCCTTDPMYSTVNYSCNETVCLLVCSLKWASSLSADIVCAKAAGGGGSR